MSSMLASRFREEMAKSKNAKMSEAVFDVMYPTGFLPVDFLNGYKVHVNPPRGNDFSYNSVGIVDGSSTMIIGRSGCGKTTYVVQIAANIARQFPNAVIFYDDIEGGSNDVYRQTLMKFSPEEMNSRVIYRNTAISAENFYERIAVIYEEKINNRAEYEYDTGLVDTRGNKIYKLVPTIYILDSFAMLVPDKLTEEESLSGQMSTTATAKTNTAVIKRIVPKLKAANIILFSINHINDNVEINPFSHSKAQISGLKQNETLPGGKAALYLANNMIRVDDGTKLKSSEGLGVDGKIVEFSFIKSRTNSSGRVVPMVFVDQQGFDELLSLFMFMKSTGAIEMKGASCYLRGTPFKFSQKEFKSMLVDNIEFREAFNKVAKEELEKLLNVPDDNVNFNNAKQDILNSILSIG